VLPFCCCVGAGLPEEEWVVRGGCIPSRRFVTVPRWVLHLFPITDAIVLPDLVPVVWADDYFLLF